MRVGASGCTRREATSSVSDDPGWIGVGFIVADAGLLILLLMTGLAFWWKRSQKPVAGRIVSGLAVLYRRAAGDRVARDVRQVGLSVDGLTEPLLRGREIPRKRGIGSLR